MEDTCANKADTGTIEKTFISLADNMAASASMFNAHGYDEFIRCRDKYIEVLKEYVKSGSIPDYMM